MFGFHSPTPHYIHMLFKNWYLYLPDLYVRNVFRNIAIPCDIWY